MTIQEWRDPEPVAVPTEQLVWPALVEAVDAESWACPTCGHAPHFDNPERECREDSCPCQAVGA